MTTGPSGPSPDTASFRDPAGFVYRRDGVVYRQVNASFAASWAAYLSSGLYDELVDRGLLIPHEPVPNELAADRKSASSVIRPLEVSPISYPYEWAFSQLKDAALATLEIQERALMRGQTLRDASSFNIQFVGGRPTLIDSLSFAPLDARVPWVAYRQFCETFLAPLALMAYRDPRLNVLLRDFLDGVPLDLAARLLPLRTRWQPRLAAHLHLHARAQARAAAPPSEQAPALRRAPGMSLTKHRALVDHLRRSVASLKVSPTGPWSDYEVTTSYTTAAAASKGALVREFLAAAGGRMVLDVGANTGAYSVAAAQDAHDVVAVDSDWSAIERLYLRTRQEKIGNLLPLVADLANPTPAIGWNGEERKSLAERVRADTVMALALIHHLAIGRTVPLPMICHLLSQLGRSAIVEFVPKDDPMARALLSARDDIFPGYDLAHFRQAASTHFTIEREARIDDSSRVMFLLAPRD